MIFYNYLKELKWSYTHNHGLFLNENEIVELTRSSETEVQEKIALNCYGEAHTEGKSKKPLGYNIFNVMADYRQLDKLQRKTIEFLVSTGIGNNMPRKKKQEFTIVFQGTKKEKEEGKGRLMIYVPLLNGGRSAVYGKTDKEVTIKAYKRQLEDRQSAFLEELSKLDNEALEKLDIRLISLMEEQSRTSDKDADTKKVLTFEEAFMHAVHTRVAKKEIKGQTRDNYINVYNRIFKNNKGFTQRPISEIETDDVYDILEEVVNRGITRHNFVNTYVVVRLPFRFIMSLRKTDPYKVSLQVSLDELAEKVKGFNNRFTIPKKEEEAYNEEDVDDCISAIYKLMSRKPNIKSRYYLIMANFYLGLRAGELAALSVEDVDMDQKVLYVRHSKTTKKEYDENMQPGKYLHEIGDTKTPNAVRELQIVDEVYEIFTELFAYRKRKGYRGKYLISDDGRAKDYTGALKGAYRQIRIEMANNIHGHLQRKTFATMNYLNPNVEDKELQKMLGHSSLVTTLNKYILPMRKSREKLRAAVQSTYSKKIQQNSAENTTK